MSSLAGLKAQQDRLKAKIAALPDGDAKTRAKAHLAEVEAAIAKLTTKPKPA